MDNKEIKFNIEVLVGSLLKEVTVKPDQRPIIVAGLELVTNLLCNINDMAESARFNMGKKE